jgi:hypothetical protein
MSCAGSINVVIGLHDMKWYGAIAKNTFASAGTDCKILTWDARELILE